MAIAFDATSSGDTAGTPALTNTVAHTCTGSNLVLVVGVIVFNGSDVLTGVTYNGVAMTFVRKNGFNDTTTPDRWLYTYLLVSPASGAAHNIVATASSSSNQAIVAVSYTGCDPTQPDASAAAHSVGTVLTTPVTPIANNCWGVVNGSMTGLLAMDVLSGGTARAISGNLGSGAGFDRILIGDFGPITPAASHSFTMTNGSTGENQGHALSLAPLAGGGATTAAAIRIAPPNFA